MNMPKSVSQDGLLLALVGAGLIILPISNAVGQVPLYLASVVWGIRALWRRTVVVPSTWAWFGGISVIIAVSFFYALYPDMGVSKLNRFLLLPLTGAVTAACLESSDPRRILRMLCLCLIAGVSLMGVYDFIRFPLEMRDRVVVETTRLEDGGEPVDIVETVPGSAFVDVGDMTSPQFYMVGILLWLGVFACRRPAMQPWMWACLPVMATGLLIHQKRGVWLACAASVGLWILWTRRWKMIVALVLLGCLGLSLPFVRTRLADIPGHLQAGHGSRGTLWTEVAPRMFEQHLWGVGLNGSTYEDFREVLPRSIHLEVGLRHLHNNFLQLRLELGWQGALFWTAWMLWILVRALRSARGPDGALAAGVAFALVALHVNGLVEYNFGDSEVQKVFLFLFGCVDATFLLRTPRVQT